MKEKEEAKAEDEFIDSLKNNFLDSFKNLCTAPAHLSRIRDYVAYSNLCRVYWVFCRLTLVSGFTLAKETHFLEKLDKILGTHTDADKIIDTLKAPNGVLNYFSVGLFLFRFAIDFGLLIRHTFSLKRVKVIIHLKKFGRALNSNFINATAILPMIWYGQPLIS